MDRELIVSNYLLENQCLFRNHPPELFYKKAILKILQYSQKNTCVGVSFRINLQSFRSATLFKADSGTSVFQ